MKQNRIEKPEPEIIENELHPSIRIKNAWQNNLKNIDLEIPHNEFVVITGVSGSGKSSLAFETLYEEGRRRYVESLSSYVRQFLGKLQKPNVDYIKGLPPAICIEQKRSTSNSRSTVGTITELYHYLKLLYARAGITYSPVSGKEVKRHTVDDAVDFVMAQPAGTQIRILSPVVKNPVRNWQEEFIVLLQKGYTRLVIDNEIHKVEEMIDLLTNQPEMDCGTHSGCFILIDRMLKEENGNGRSRIADSVQTAFFEGHNKCVIELNESEYHSFSYDFEEDGIVFEEPVPDLFSFNSPHGACPACGGFGEMLGIDEDKVVPNKYLSVMDGAVVCWEGEKMSEWRKDFVLKASKLFKFPIYTPYYQLTDSEKDLLWNGSNGVEGINAFFSYLESNTYKIHYRIIISRYKGRATCRYCGGKRLRKEASYIKIGGKSIGELAEMPVSDLKLFFENFTKENVGNKLTERLLREINIRLKMMVEIGLGYLTLNRTGRTLSGGETQRIQLIYSLGSNLTGSLYILDEPSIGLHSKDTFELIKILRGLQTLGNTVVVVEHDEDIIRSADRIIDLGPGAGSFGGKVVFSGTFNEIKNATESLTAAYLEGKLKIELPHIRRNPEKFIEITGASKHNLKNIDVSIPVGGFTVVTGVSGSGKTTLVRDIVFESLKNDLPEVAPEPVFCKSIKLPSKSIIRAEFVGQEGIDRSRRSNAVTYMKVFDHIRELFAQQKISKINGFTPAYFSFNVDGGRCDECKGDGYITIEMQFMADMHLLCESCKGKRYKEEILDVKWNEKNIDDVLKMTVSEAMQFFAGNQHIVSGLKPLMQVGLDYVALGQATSTLSGGEAQRLKLASFLSHGNKTTEPLLFIFDEPTTGLHWNDIKKLLDSFDALLKIGHTVLVIEHNLEVIKNADYIIDLGPGGGHAGGNVVYQGIPEGILKINESETAKYLAKKLVNY